MAARAIRQALCLLAGAIVLAPAIALAAPGPACIAGNYQGSAPEIAAQVILQPSGRYIYMLTYGALDETSEGQWRVEEGRLELKSDPVTPPRFVFLGEEVSSDGAFRIDLDLPEGISRQYFDAQFTFADGSRAERQFAEDGLAMDVTSDNEPKALRVVLPMFAVASAWQPVTRGRASHLRFRFEPNDIGKVELDAGAAVLADGAILLQRHDRRLRLSRQPDDCHAP